MSTSLENNYTLYNPVNYKSNIYNKYVTNVHFINEGKFTEVAWRYYESGDSPDEVSDYYGSEMPEEGWNEVGNFDTQVMKWFLFTKNNENDMAMVWVSPQDDQTIFTLMRASK